MVNAILNYLLIYGVGGLPELGGEGCGWATALTMWFELALVLPFLSRPWLRRIRLKEGFRGFDLRETYRIISIGLPIGLTHLLEMMVFSVLRKLFQKVVLLRIWAKALEKIQLTVRLENSVFSQA